MLLVVSAVVFFCTQALPGDIARQVLGQNATAEQIENPECPIGVRPASGVAVRTVALGYAAT